MKIDRRSERGEKNRGPTYSVWPTEPFWCILGELPTVYVSTSHANAEQVRSVLAGRLAPSRRSASETPASRNASQRKRARILAISELRSYPIQSTPSSFPSCKPANSKTTNRACAKHRRMPERGQVTGFLSPAAPDQMQEWQRRMKMRPPRSMTCRQRK